MDAELRALLGETVTVYPWASDSAYGSPTYSTSGTAYPARVERKSKLVTAKDGRQVVAGSVIYLGPSSTGGLPGLTARDKLVLADGTSPEILSVERQPDETGATYYEAAFCG